MPFDGNGVYAPLTPPVFPAVPNTTILASQYNQQLLDIAGALNNALTRDGQGKPTVDIDWNNKRIRNMLGPALSGDAATKGYADTGDALRALKIGDTFTGNVGIVRSTADDANFALEGPSGTNKYISFRTTGGLNRWGVFSSADAESGGNSGSNFIVNRHADNGAFLSSTFLIRRDTGTAHFEELTVDNTQNRNKLNILGWSDNRGVGILMRPSLGGTQTCVLFTNSASGGVGAIYTNDTGTTYATTSDYRLKQNWAPIAQPCEVLSRINFYEGEFKAEPGTKHHYVIAHELQDAVPNAHAVVGAKDGKHMQGVDYAKLVPLLGAALQEALKRIEELEVKLGAA